MITEPQKEHQWLHKLIGEWTYEGESRMEPAQPLEKFKGTETVRSLGGLWIIAEGHGESSSFGPGTTLMALGYDPQKRRYVGSFVASVVPQLWVYDGELDESGRMLMLDSEGPSWSDIGKTSKYRDVIEFKSDDDRVMTSYVMGDDGEWHSFMKLDFRRVK